MPATRWKFASQTPNLLAIAKKFLKKRHAPVFHSGRKFVRGA
jgi:hypothetical protein